MCLLAAVYDLIKLATSSRDDQDEWDVTTLHDDIERNVSRVGRYWEYSLANNVQVGRTGAVRLD